MNSTTRPDPARVAAYREALAPYTVGLLLPGLIDEIARELAEQEALVLRDIDGDDPGFRHVRPFRCYVEPLDVSGPRVVRTDEPVDGDDR